MIRYTATISHPTDYSWSIWNAVALLDQYKDFDLVEFKLEYSNYTDAKTVIQSIIDQL